MITKPYIIYALRNIGTELTCMHIWLDDTLERAYTDKLALTGSSIFDFNNEPLDLFCCTKAVRCVNRALEIAYKLREDTK